MRRTARWLLASAVLVGGCFGAGSQAGVDEGQPGPTASDYTQRVWPIFQRSCVGCHSGPSPAAGLDMAPFVSEEIARSDRARLARIRARVGAGEMPPPPATLQAEERRVVLDWLDSVIMTDDCSENLDPGAPRARRLTKRELQNTLRDLLQLGATPVGLGLPEEAANGGFGNDELVLQVNAELLGAVVDAVVDAIDKAFATNSASRAALLPCASARDEACVAQALHTFAERAFRRPLDAAERAWVDEQRLAHADALRDAFAAVLLAPQVQLKIEVDPQPDDSTAVHPLSAHELATRLSYLLTESTPDEELRRAAADASLLQPEQLLRQAQRLLESPRCTLVSGMAHEWLHLDRLTLDDEALQTSMLAESDALLRRVLVGGEAPISHLLASPVTVVDARLAAHYGLPAPRTSDEPVATAGTARQNGVLTQAAWLSVTAGDGTTSPVERGKMVLDQLLCRPPPPPPPDVDTNALDAAETNKREALAAHRADPACASCHSSMDPIGLALETFGSRGELRERDERGDVIDPSGTLPLLGDFRDHTELGHKLAADPGLTECVTQKLVSYARGRAYRAAEDACVGRALVQRGGGSFVQTLFAYLESPSFRTRRGGRPLPEGATP